MAEMNGKELAYYRAAGLDAWLKPMNSDERNVRRSWMRRALIGTIFQNCSNEMIDRMRIIMREDYMFVEDENGYEYALPSKKNMDDVSQYRMERAMIPEEYTGKMCIDFNWSLYGEDTENAKSVILKYLSNFPTFKDQGMGLYIYSAEKGSGKTMLSCCVLNEISKKHIGIVKFVNVIDFVEMTKKGFNYDNPDIEALYIANTLVIDDIGAQLDKAWIDTVLYRLINDRYANHKVTIFTSNIEAKDLKIDSRIIDRIESRSFNVHLPEVPVRRILAEKKKEKMLSA